MALLHLRFPMLILAAMLSLGVFVGNRLEGVPIVYFGIPSLLLGACAFVANAKQKKLLACALVGVSTVFAGVCHAIRNVPPTEDHLSRSMPLDWQPCAVRVSIVSAAVWQPNPNHRPQDPKSNAWVTQWKVHCTEVRDRSEWKDADSLTRLTVEGRIDRFLPGDEIEVLGSCRKIGRAANPGGFDFLSVSKRDHHFIMLRAEAESQLRLLSSRWGWFTFSRLRGICIREIDQSLRRWVAFGKAPLASALVFGQRQQVEWQDQQELMATGTLHMLSISGLHVEILAAMLFAVCRFTGVSQFTTFIVLSMCTWGYAGLSGGDPPVVRAAVQVTIFAFAAWIGRRTRIGNLLGCAAIVVVLLRASNLENVGVQLSFLAVATIGFFVSATRRELVRDRLQAVVDEATAPWKLWVRSQSKKLYDMALLSAWITLLTTPLIWTNFHVLSPIAIPLNVIIALPLTISLLSGICVGLLGWIPPIGYVSGWICGASLAFISTVVEWGKAVPCGHFWLPSPSAAWVVVFYAIALFWIFAFGKRGLRFLAAILLLWITIAALPWLSGPRGWLRSGPQILGTQTDCSELRCTFLSVGHGTSVMIEHPSGEVWLYDAGHMGSPDRSHQEIAASLWSLPTARIDRLIISHADSDHYNACLGLLERFAVGEIVSTPQFWKNDARDIVRLKRRLDRFRSNQAEWFAPYRDSRKCGAF